MGPGLTTGHCDQWSWRHNETSEYGATQRIRRILLVPGVTDTTIECLLRLGTGSGDDARRLRIRPVAGGPGRTRGRGTRIPLQAGRQPAELRPPGLGRRWAIRPRASPAPCRPARARRPQGISGDVRAHRRAAARPRPSPLGNVGDRRPPPGEVVRGPQGPPRTGRRRGRGQPAGAAVQHGAGRAAAETGPPAPAGHIPCRSPHPD